MARRDDSLQARLERDLAELKLLEIAKSYREVLDEAARARQLDAGGPLHLDLALEHRPAAASPRASPAPGPASKQKTLAEYKFDFPEARPQSGHPAAVQLRLHRATWVRRVDWTHRHGKVASLDRIKPALAAERGYSVRHTRAVDMINHLVMAQANGLLGQAIKAYVRPTLLLLDELGYLPIDKRGADLAVPRWSLPVMNWTIADQWNLSFRE